MLTELVGKKTRPTAIKNNTLQKSDKQKLLKEDSVKRKVVLEEHMAPEGDSGKEGLGTCAACACVTSQLSAQTRRQGHKRGGWVRDGIFFFFFKQKKSISVSRALGLQRSHSIARCHYHSFSSTTTPPFVPSFILSSPLPCLLAHSSEGLPSYGHKTNPFKSASGGVVRSSELDGSARERSRSIPQSNSPL